MKQNNTQQLSDPDLHRKAHRNRPHSICLGYHQFWGTEPHAGHEPTQYDVDLDVAVNQVRRTIELGLPIERFKNLASIRESDCSANSVISMPIDDGHRSGLPFAEALSQLGVSATFFVTPKFMMDQEGFFSRSDLRTLLELGMDIGAHGFSHAKLSNLPQERLMFELKASKEWIEDAIQQEVTTMVAPAGFIGPREISAAHSVGYELVGNSLERPSPLPIKNGVVDRICVRRHYDSGTFDKIISNDMLFYLGKRMRNRALYIPKKIVSKFR